MKKWLKIKITTNPVLVDSISDFLVGIIGAGVEIGVDDHIFLTPINCFLPKEDPEKEEITIILKQIESYLSDLTKIFNVDRPVVSWEILEDEDWGKTWKTYFSPFAIIPGLVIAPTWEKYQAAPNEHVIVMDPGMAFGTGHHATTALSLELIADELHNDGSVKNVLDVGTGTGILGMAAAFFGAEKVLGIDNDPEAVMAARENVELNRLISVMEVDDILLADLEDQYSLVVANIIHDVLVQMAADLVRTTKVGGRLVLSGILHGKQSDNIIVEFKKFGVLLEKQKQRGEWVVLQLKKI